MKNPRTRNPAAKKYRYVVKVVEEVESSTAIESDVKLPWSRIEEIAEHRRVKGELSFASVNDVDIYCDTVFVNGKEVHHP